VWSRPGNRAPGRQRVKVRSEIRMSWALIVLTSCLRLRHILRSARPSFTLCALGWLV
jgi:hypothetical protein